MLGGAPAVEISGLTLRDAARGIANYGQLTVSDSRIVDNSTTPESGFAGGGILNYGTLTVQRSTIAGNESEVGGGIYGHGGASTTILDSTLSDNFAGDSGGGIYTIGELTVVNSTISGNRAIGDGGGIADFTGDRVALTNVTVVFNQADADGDGAGTGGGLRGSGDTVLHNSIVVGNTRGNGNSPSDYAGSIDLSSSFNLFGSLGGFQGGEPDTALGNLYYSADPRLGPLADNGGPTQTHALLGGSPAIEAGSSLRAVGPAGAPLLTDQRGAGYPRRAGSTVDIGAYEVAAANPTTFTVTTLLDEDDGGLGLGTGDSLREVMRAANDNVGSDTIAFALPAGSTISLSAGPLPILVDDVTISGPGANELSIGENPEVTIFQIGVLGGAPEVEISGLTLRGAAQGDCELRPADGARQPDC